MLGLLERGESLKARIYDEVPILDDKQAAFLPGLLQEQARKQIGRHGAEAPLWDFGAKEYLKVWRSCVTALGIEAFATSPYQNRHGGASRGITSSTCATWPRSAGEGDGPQKAVRGFTSSSSRSTRADSGRSGTKSSSTSRFRSLVPKSKWFGDTAAWCDPARLLSLFGGAGECAKFVSSQGGVAALKDIEHHEANDLGKWSAWNDVMSQVANFSAVGIDIPCNTWIRARRGKPGSRMPGPLRRTTTEEIMGRD